MRCLLVSDLHYSLQQFDWVSDVASDFDLVVLAGDHLDISGYVDPHVQTAVVMKYFRKLSSHTKVIVCSGNHDLDAHNAAGEKFSRWIGRAKHLGIATDGDAFELAGTLFTICPWWDGPQSRDAVGAQFERDSLRRSGSWIWVYHSPPEGSPTSWSESGHFGDVELSQWIETYSPNIVLTGHIHESPFRTQGSWVDRLGSTWVFNAGRQTGPIPAHIIFDTTEQAALWFSMGEEQGVQMDCALTRPILPLTEFPAWFK